MTTYNFNVCAAARNTIHGYGLTPAEEAVVIRCVGGYSKSKSFGETIKKTQYKWSQSFNSDPDWKQSIRLLDTRRIAPTVVENNPGATIVANVIGAPFALLGYLLEESGTDKLKALIKRNS